MDPIVIRPATMSDMETLLHFEQGVYHAELAFDPTLRQPPNHYYDIPELISSPQIQLLVAEYDGIVAGSGYARIEKARHFLKHSLHAYLGFMYVDPDYRGKGVNQAIMKGLEDWARSQGIVEMVLEVNHGNHRAIKAYEKSGFSPILVQMRKGI